MKKWKRIEAGYYKLVGTEYEVINVQGMSVRWSGAQCKPWKVRSARDGHHISSHWYKRDAQRAAEKKDNPQ